jgi:hypothetical protein
MGPLDTATEVDLTAARIQEPSASPWRDECGLTEVTLCFSDHSSRFVARVDAIFFGADSVANRYRCRSRIFPLTRSSVIYGLPNLFAAPFACRTHLPDGPRTGDQQWIAHLSM